MISNHLDVSSGPAILLEIIDSRSYIRCSIIYVTKGRLSSKLLEDSLFRSSCIFPPNLSTHRISYYNWCGFIFNFTNTIIFTHSLPYLQNQLFYRKLMSQYSFYIRNLSNKGICCRLNPDYKKDWIGLLGIIAFQPIHLLTWRCKLIRIVSSSHLLYFVGNFK